MKFVYFILLRKYDLIHINTILNYKGIFRDSIYILIARLFHKKILIFFRGWDDDIEKVIEKRYYRLFNYVLSGADAIVSLSSDSISSIRKWGFTKRLFLETTTVDINLISQIGESDILSKNYDSQYLNILYLGRIEKEKGIYICLEAFALLVKSFPDIKLKVAGDGTEYENMLSYIKDNNIKNVEVYGFVKGSAKENLLRQSHFFILTSLREGLPNALLEAIAAGLVIIARPVAGIKDVVIHGENGFISESKNAGDFAKLIRDALVDRASLKEISKKNYYSARNIFYSDVVAARLINIYNSVISS